MNYLEYLLYTSDLQVENNHWRKGQTLFNALYRVRPELADRYRGSDIDPFYRDDRIGEFLRAVERDWHL